MVGVRWAPWILLWLAAVASAARVIEPWAAGQVGYDSAASAMFFDRIARGLQLEAFITVTPKPLLTAVYGISWTLTEDWRSLSVLAIGVYGVDVVLAARLAHRVAGPVAGGFAAVAFLGSGALLEDVSAAYAVAWALLGWLVAALAVTADRPRYALAGVALALAGLARFETVLLVAWIAFLLAALHMASGRWPSLRPRAGAWLLLAGVATIPVQVAHDLMLTGEPFWSQSVPVVASVGVRLRDPIEMLRWIVTHYAPMGPHLLLGALGVAWLVHHRKWTLLAGLSALGPGILAFLVALAARDVYVSPRYATPADLALLFVASIGAATVSVALVETFVRRWIHAGTSRDAWLRVAAGALAGLLLATDFGPLDPALRARVRTNLAMFENVDAALPALRVAVERVPGARSWPADPSPSGRADDAAFLVPVLLRPRLAMELDLPLTAITGLDGKRLTTDGSYPRPGQVVHHDPRGNLPPEAFAILEVSEPTRRDAVLLVPLDARPDLGYWVVAVEAP